MTQPADLVLVGAHVEPIALRSQPADAVAVRAGRISAVGTAADVEGLVGPRTRLIRLHGETLLPGFQDAHVHPVYGGLTLRSCNLHGLPDQDAYLAALAAYAAGHPELEWLTGDGWTYGPFPGGIPRRETLDQVVADLNPYIRGARHYFRRVRRRSLSRLDFFVDVRLARWWARKHHTRRPAWSLVSRDALRRQRGLERWNLPIARRPADARFAR